MKDFEIYGIKNLEKINSDYLEEIKNFSKNEHNLIISKDMAVAPFLLDKTYREIHMLKDKLKCKAYTKTYIFQTEIEKSIFVCNAIFIDSNKFLDCLYKCNSLQLLSKIVNFNNYLEERYEDEPSLIKIQKLNFYRNVITKNKKQLKNTINYFYKLYKVSDLNIIVNKLSQLIYFDNELYNTYMSNIENQEICIMSKVKKG